MVKVSRMRTAHAIDMPSTPDSVVHMSKMIQIRNVPDDMHRMLKMRAVAEGISLSDLIKRELGISTEKISFEELDARREARDWGPSKLKPGSAVRYIRESRGEF
jgi:antitoxin FitA